MATAMAMATVLLLFVLATPVVHSVQYTVPWDLSTSYGSWATKKLNVGDVLVFTYISELHSVDVVTATNYAGCTTANPLASFTGGQSSVPLTAPGPMYFICPTEGHCLGGMKLSITVSAAATPTTPATPPTAPAAAPPPASTNATAPTPSPSPTTTLKLSPSPSPYVSPSPAVMSPTGSPASAPSPATSTSSATASPPGSSGGARSVVGEMNHFVVIGFSVVVAGLAGLMV